MARIQTTHNYHPIEVATELWKQYVAEIDKFAVRSEAYRADKEEERRDESERRDASWRPPTGA